MLKLACDNQIGNSVIDGLKSLGYTIVVKARDLPDEEWLAEACEKDVDVVISPDLDIPNLIEKHQLENIYWIDVPQGFKKRQLFLYLKNSLHSIKEVISGKVQVNA